VSDGYGQLCPECGDPYIGGPGCYAGACGADPEDCEHGRWNPDNGQCLDCGDLSEPAPYPRSGADR